MKSFLRNLVKLLRTTKLKPSSCVVLTRLPLVPHLWTEEQMPRLATGSGSATGSKLSSWVKPSPAPTTGSLQRASLQLGVASFFFLNGAPPKGFLPLFWGFLYFSQDTLDPSTQKEMRFVTDSSQGSQNGTSWQSQSRKKA